MSGHFFNAESLGALAFARLHKALAVAYMRRKLRRAPHKAPEEDDEFEPIQLRRNDSVATGIDGLIGNTPLLRIKSLSDLTGCEILGKAEFLNPGGSPKDRVALQIIQEAEESGELVPNMGSWIFEGTVGSTGISLATLARAKGYNCCIVVPDDVAEEKAVLLRRLGATVELVRPRGIVDPRHFVNEARARAQNWKPDENEPYATAFFADQFETEANFYAHYQHTGPEIWKQTNGELDAFVSGTGTGGTLSGVATFLKETAKVQGRRHSPLIVVADPPGSGVYNRIKFGVMYNSTEAEGTRRRYQVDTVVEGIGLNRLTHNLELGLPVIDTAEHVTDDEAVRMSRWLAKHDGLFLGSSSAVHCVAAVRTALRLKKDDSLRTHRDRPIIVTILADSGTRHLSKFQNDDVMQARGLRVDDDISDILQG
ncbi:cysteine synthase [Malassezia pachydermatis]|uniref:cysteine synthase n=1 Tax=Malassezia pachydermatis TaxID=77020 RepID=A0A0N0RSE7_9BASI|nr:cysteine synthase [Malassezia pachydermatis]KOS15029.1 cysteine synthase [Malassezia pachydermatis]